MDRNQKVGAVVAVALVLMGMVLGAALAVLTACTPAYAHGYDAARYEVLGVGYAHYADSEGAAIWRFSDGETGREFMVVESNNGLGVVEL